MSHDRNSHCDLDIHLWKEFPEEEIGSFSGVGTQVTTTFWTNSRPSRPRGCIITFEGTTSMGLKFFSRRTFTCFDHRWSVPGAPSFGVLLWFFEGYQAYLECSDEREFFGWVTTYTTISKCVVHLQNKPCNRCGHSSARGST